MNPNKSQRALITFIILNIVYPLNSTPLVYNLKIRRVFTGLNAFLQRPHKPVWALTFVPIFYRRASHITNERSGSNLFEKRRGGGSLFNLRYVPSRSWWLELTTAVQKESVATTGTANFCASRAGFDDVVLAGGHNVFPTEDLQLSIYGLAGFPTRTKVTLEEAEGALVGGRFYVLGGGGEMSYSFINRTPQSVVGIVQMRYLHLFSRRWQPILPPGGRIQPGDTIDFLFGLRYRHELTSFEMGYNPTIFINQAVILPTETIRSKTAVRHGIYASCMHLCKRVRIANKPFAVGAGIVYNRFGKFAANSVNVWLNFTIII